MSETDSGTLAYYEREAVLYQELRARPVQAYTHEMELELVRAHLKPGARVLDLGCGEGRFARALWALEQGVEVLGIDFSAGMIAEAKKRRAPVGPDFEVGDATNLRFQNGVFDLIFSATCLNNVPDIGKALDEAWRVLAPGGVFIAVVINRNEWASRLRFVATFVMWLNRRLRKDAWFRRTYTREQLNELFGARFEDVSVRGLRLIPDLLPEMPFNIWRPLFPFTRALLKRLKTVDERLTRAGFWSHRARFHVVVARKPS